MGGLFSSPKMPTYTAPTAPTTDTASAEAALLDERKRRAKQTGSAGNIQSSLVGATSDVAAITSKSTLLGG